MHVFARDGLSSVVLNFALRDRRRLPLDGMAAYVGRVGIYRDFNALGFRLAPSDLAHWLVSELEKARAVRREGRWPLPA